jgi:hypothetical protein
MSQGKWLVMSAPRKQDRRQPHEPESRHLHLLMLLMAELRSYHGYYHHVRNEL